MNNQTKSQKTNADITAFLKARNTLLWIVTPEEERVERAIVDAAGKASFQTAFWDCATGLSRLDPETGEEISISAEMQEPIEVYQHIREHDDRRVYVLRDLHKWLDNGVVLRGLRSLARHLQPIELEKARAIVVLTPSSEVPPELTGHAIVIEYPLPERADIAQVVKDSLSVLPDDIAKNAVEDQETVIDAALGLTIVEASNCYNKSLVMKRRIDPALVISEKKRVIAREHGLTWCDPDPRGLEAIGGYDILKRRLSRLKGAFSQRARDFGLPSPKGLFLSGIPGCGKSLTAKAVAGEWGFPLLRLDPGATKSKWLGESEANIRKALALAETVAPCVLWIDEIEKALAGATNTATGDSGVSADALGTLLSWMQERTAPVFVIATANDISSLPPELLRKGRFDDLFFVDLPNAKERTEILRATLRQFNRDPDSIDCETLSTKMLDGFTGAEIAALVPEALFEAFADDERAITSKDIEGAAEGTVPLCKTAAEKIDRLRNWAKDRARPTSSEEEVKPTNGRKATRKLDI